MTSLGVGRWHIEINDARLDSSYVELGAFLQSINKHVAQGADVHCRLELQTSHGPAHTFLDSDHDSIRLLLPLGPVANIQVASIAVLQSAFRGLALLTDDPALVLLHGSAVTTRDSRFGIAVIDGGTGAGKTSLSLALSELGYPLVIDEFLLCEAKADHLVAFCQPNLPWHIRRDMAPYLIKSGNRSGLCAFPRLASGCDAVPIKVLLIPDWSLPVGTCAIDQGQPPESCLSDHLKKFADPRLDHVSLFARNVDSLTVNGGSHRLHGLVERQIATMKRSMLRAASSLTLLRVGMGLPNEVGLVAQAVANRLDSISP